MSKQTSDLERCKRASQMFPGAPISRKQQADLESHVTPSQKRKVNANRDALREYAETGDSSNLDPQVKVLLKSLNHTYAKSWSRKTAAMVSDAMSAPRKRAPRSQPQA